MEHLVATSRHLPFALNHRCVKLRITDVKLHYDLFNMLVCSTTSYACEVWVDSKKIEAIEVVYRGFLKSLLGVRKTTNTSIVLAEFSKFPFEQFAWGQALLYNNRVSTVIKDCILGKAWEAQLVMLVTRNKCWVGSMKKWLLKNEPQEVAGFLPLVQLLLETAPQLVTIRAFQARIAQPLLGMVPRTTHIHSTRLTRVRSWAESQILWCNAHNVQVGAQMVKLAALQLMQPVNAKSTMRGPINQEARAPPLLGFPHTMLSVKKVKDNM